MGRMLRIPYFIAERQAVGGVSVADALSAVRETISKMSAHVASIGFGGVS
jgi:hypothetical protein